MVITATIPFLEHDAQEHDWTVVSLHFLGHSSLYRISIMGVFSHYYHLFNQNFTGRCDIVYCCASPLIRHAARSTPQLMTWLFNASHLFLLSSPHIPLASINSLFLQLWARCPNHPYVKHLLSLLYPLYISCCSRVKDIVSSLNCWKEIVVINGFGRVDCSGFVIRIIATGAHNLYPASYPTNYWLLVFLTN